MSDANAKDALARPLAEQFTRLPKAWRDCLGDYLHSPAQAALCAFVDGERAAGKTIYPDDVFRALTLTPLESVKVVILGQDPYHGEDRGVPQAHGLAFSVRPGVRPPPSLRNIFKEIDSEFGWKAPASGCLDPWARQGVLLLNTVLTVEAGKAASHARHGWEACTDRLIACLGARQQPMVFMLWGAHAQAKRDLVRRAGHHRVLETTHPSPLSAHRGFLGSGHFAAANAFLEQAGQTPIDWRLSD